MLNRAELKKKRKQVPQARGNIETHKSGTSHLVGKSAGASKNGLS